MIICEKVSIGEFQGSLEAIESILVKNIPSNCEREPGMMPITKLEIRCRDKHAKTF